MATSNLEWPPCSTKLKKQAIAARVTTRRTNLTPPQHRLLTEVANDDRFIVVNTDKNLGPAIMDRVTYIERALIDHLGNTNTYEYIARHLANKYEKTQEKG